MTETNREFYFIRISFLLRVSVSKEVDKKATVSWLSFSFSLRSWTMRSRLCRTCCVVSCALKLSVTCYFFYYLLKSFILRNWIDKREKNANTSSVWCGMSLPVRFIHCAINISINLTFCVLVRSVFSGSVNVERHINTVVWKFRIIFTFLHL